MGNTTSTSRIAKNTLLLYFRQILIMLVSLYTVRVVLNVLGAEDYGIYNVTAGVVTMFGFLSGAMATASQRYFAFDLGKQDYEHLKTTFSVTFQIYVLLAAVIVLLAETAGLWFVINKLVIPPERLSAAIWIFQAAVISFLLTLITTPYKACIIAHENMNIYAYVSIVEAVLKLAIVFLLQVLNFDKLALYGFLLTFVAIIITTIYRVHCKKHYSECKFQFIKDKALFKELVTYSGWCLFGHTSSMVRNQGTNILLNLFFNPIVNAARAVAAQVNVAVLSFAQNFSTALRPQIIKSYAADDNKFLLKMTIYGTKIVFFLMLVICIPIFFETPYILELWLKNVPEHTTAFVQLIIIDVLIDSISYPLMAVIQATGKIKMYQAVVGGILILNLPVSYVFLKLGFPAESVFGVAIVLSVIAFFLRIVIVQKHITFNLATPIIKLFFRFILLAGIASLVPFVLINKLDNTLLHLVLFVSVSVIWCGSILFLFGLNKEERKLFINKIKNRFL